MARENGQSSVVVATVVGARPQFVKAAMVSQAFRQAEGIAQILIHTGQHYDDAMSGVFFRELGIPEPDYNLGIGSGSHGKQTGMMLEKIEEVLIERRPDWLLVYGDTNSTLAGALAAAKLHIPVAHVEAGLRSYNRNMPEEINRIVTDCISDLLFTPSDTATRNLLGEGIKPEKICQTGDVMLDAVLHYSRIAESSSKILSQIGIAPKAYILATVHRADNTDNPKLLGNILNALLDVSDKIDVVLPVHPRTKAAIERLGWQNPNGRHFIFTEPAGYLDMLMLEKNARLIATDSGGVQKEAYFCGIPCVVLRNESEWVELLESGHNCLCPPTSRTQISQAILESMNKSPQSPPAASHPYGQGTASQKVVEAILAISRH